MTDLALPGITLVIGLPIALWLTSPGRLARRAAWRWRRAVDETVLLVRPVLAGHPARLLPGLLPGPHGDTAAVVVRTPGRGTGRTCTADATAARAGRATASVVPSQLDPSSLGQLAVVGAGSAAPIRRVPALTTFTPVGGVAATTPPTTHTSTPSTERVSHGLETATGTGSFSTSHPCSSLPATCTVRSARPCGGRAVHGPQVDVAGGPTVYSPAASAGRQTRTAS